MKKILLLLALTITANFVSGQRSIDALFEKYAGHDGFVTVTISGNLLKLAACLGDDDDFDENVLPAHITEIRILAQEKGNQRVENFYEAVTQDLNLSPYDEFMRIKESDQDLKMLVRSEGNKLREFLLIAGGEDNAIIQIKGNMTFNEARKFSAKVKTDHGMSIVSENK
jgi:hypothetical protein